MLSCKVGYIYLRAEAVSCTMWTQRELRAQHTYTQAATMCVEGS